MDKTSVLNGSTGADDELIDRLCCGSSFLVHQVKEIFLHSVFYFSKSHKFLAVTVCCYPIKAVAKG